MRSAVILAGGFGRRLGLEKSLLLFDKRPLICWTAERISPVADEIVIVARDETHCVRLEEVISAYCPDLVSGMKVAFTWDSVSRYGPVAGLYSGMKKAKGALAFAAACDLPFLSPMVVDRLFSLLEAWENLSGKDEADEDGENESSADGANGRGSKSQCAVPEHPGGQLEPLHCVYDREAMQNACQKAMEIGEQRVHAPLLELVMKRVPVESLRPLDADLLTFFNLNTKKDLDRALALWPGF
jgi:molybdopterin-guanine dinucleotide biosynthesis protein A